MIYLIILMNIKWKIAYVAKVRKNCYIGKEYENQ